MKVCKKCGIDKPLNEYHKDPRSSGQRTPRGGMGVQSVCKNCRADARKPGIIMARQESQKLLREGLKRCSTCKQIKSISSFHTRRASNDGLAYKCAECVVANCKNWRGKNPNAFKEWYEANKEKRAEYWKTWYEQNKESRADSYAEWAKKNKHIVTALIAKRSAAKRSSTPKWANMDAIREFYKEAAFLTEKTGIKHEVDHIYPLQGELCSGLHCESNLQVLTKVENIRKSNKMPELYD